MTCSYGIKEAYLFKLLTNFHVEKVVTLSPQVIDNNNMPHQLNKCVNNSIFLFLFCPYSSKSKVQSLEHSQQVCHMLNFWHLAHQTPKYEPHEMFQMPKFFTHNYSTVSNMRRYGQQLQMGLLLFLFSFLSHPD